MYAGKREGNAAAVLLLIVALTAGALAWGFYTPSSTIQIGPAYGSAPVPAGPVRASAPSGTYFDYIIVIMMENHAICSILQGGLDNCTSGAGPYETSLAQAYGLSTKYVKCTTPSLPNYLCTSGASTWGCTGYDGAPHSNTCTNIAWRQLNFVDTLLNNSLTFKAYMEDMPTNCSTSTSGNYAVKHDGWVYYSNNVQIPSRCKMIVPAGTSDATLLNDLGSTSTASNYMWLTPNLCNDMHDCSVATGDTYLKGLVPKILNSAVFTTQRAALFITFDEDSGTAGAPYIYTVWAGPVAKQGYISYQPYNHYSLLSTVESNWNLPPLNTTDKNAPNMDEFFVSSSPGGPKAQFIFSPAWPQVNAMITFNGSASTDPDPNATLQYRWDWTNDGTWDTGWSSSPVATYAYTAPGTYTARMEVQDNHGKTGNMTKPVVADSEPPTTTSALSGTSGTSGWYRSSVSVTLTPTDDLSGVASTKYRKDGGAWSTGTTLSVSGEGSHTVDYYSMDNAGNTESTHTISLKIDTVAPSTTATLQGTLVNNSYYDGPVNVTLSATDATSGVALTQYHVDSGAWTTYSGKFQVTGNGTHVVSFNSTDVAGNRESTKTAQVAIGSAASSAPPLTTAELAGSTGVAGWYISNVTVVLNATDPAGAPTMINVRVDGGPWQTYTVPLVLGDGRHTLDYQANDSLGHSEAVKAITVDVDATPPSLKILGPSGTLASSVATVSWTASDRLSGLAQVQVSVDGAAFQAATGTNLTVTLPDGSHYVTVKAQDTAGNTIVRVATFSIDTNPFSPNGPYMGAPLYAIIGLTPIVLGVVTLLALRRRRRRKRRALK